MRVRTRSLLLWGKNPHLLPVISKFFPAIQTYNVRTRPAGDLPCPLLGRLAGYGEAHTFVPATEQHIEYLHLLLLKTLFYPYLISESKPAFVSFVFDKT